MRAPWLAGLAALAVFFSTGDAAAFCRSTTCTKNCDTDVDGCVTTGLQLWWKTSCVGYTLDPALTQNLLPEPTRDALRKAFFAWADLDCGGGQRASITFAPLDDLACHESWYRADGPNVNLVTFKDNDWTYRGIDGTLAKTTVTFDAKTGQILDADIAINSAYNNLTVGDTKVGYDLQSIVTHEVGHLLGVAHSSDFDATMFASYEPGTKDLRTLAPDDVKAVCAAYPPGRAATCDTTPHGGLATSCPTDEPASSGCATAPGGAASTGAVLLLLAGLARAGRRARRNGCSVDVG